MSSYFCILRHDYPFQADLAACLAITIRLFYIRAKLNLDAMCIQTSLNG